MQKIITYGSKYGLTKRYAEKLAELTGLPLQNEAEVKDLSSLECIIHLGGLYAGGVRGLKKIIKKLPMGARLFVVTVGLSDVKNKANTDKIKKDLKAQIPENIFQQTQVFHLRGGIDYSKLNFFHKFVMTMIYKKIKAMPEEEKTPEIKYMIDSFNKKVDFTDFSALEPIVKAIKFQDR